MTVEDCPVVSRVMARAFFDDPLQVWALPDPTTRLSILEQVFELLSRYSSVPRGESYTDATLACAAFWVPPGPFVLDRAAAEAMAPMLDLLGDANERFRAAEDTMRAHRPIDSFPTVVSGSVGRGAAIASEPAAVPRAWEATRERG